MIRVSGQKAELQVKSRSYRPKVRVTVGQTLRIRTEWPRKGTRIGRFGFRCFYRKPPLKAFLNPPRCLLVLSLFSIHRKEKFAYQYQVPPQNFLWAKRITATNDFAYFSRKTIWTRGAEKNIEKMPSSRYRYEDIIYQILVNRPKYPPPFLWYGRLLLLHPHFFL